MRRFVLLFLAALVLLAAACARTITPAEIERKGTKPYPKQGRAQLVQATSVALKTLGFDVTVSDPNAGKVKTAPKTIQVTAVGSRYSATAYSDSLAWVIDVTPDSSGGSVLRARPRAYRNGVPLDETNLTASYMDRAFRDLFREIEDNIPGYVATTPPAVIPATSASGTSSKTAPETEDAQSKFLPD